MIDHDAWVSMVYPKPMWPALTTDAMATRLRSPIYDFREFPDAPGKFHDITRRAAIKDAADITLDTEDSALVLGDAIEEHWPGALDAMEVDADLVSYLSVYDGDIGDVASRVIPLEGDRKRMAAAMTIARRIVGYYLVFGNRNTYRIPDAHAVVPTGMSFWHRHDDGTHLVVSNRYEVKMKLQPTSFTYAALTFYRDRKSIMMLGTGSEVHLVPGDTLTHPVGSLAFRYPRVNEMNEVMNELGIW